VCQRALVYTVAVQGLYGKQCLVHWEDFGPTNAKFLLEKYRRSGPTFNDDIQSTAAVVLACVLGAARRASVPPLAQQKFVFAGAGQASLGSAALLVSALVDEVRRTQSIVFLEHSG
jgi:malic enzyme